MTKDFLDLMHLFSCGAHGTEPDSKREYNINQILRLSGEQGLYPFVFLSLEKLYNSGSLNISSNDFNYLKNQYMQVIFSSMRKNAAVNDAICQLNKNGIQTLMLKGQVLSKLYSVPEARISGDTDLFLSSSADEKKACSALEEIGFEVIERPHTSHHAMCKRADAGLIELHLSLYDELFEDIWFKNKGEKHDEYISFTTQDGYVYKTLNYTDNAIFITLHAIKHFFSEGVGIRQIMDLLLFNKTYKDKTDWGKYFSTLEKLRFKKLYDYIVFIGNMYLGFNEECSNDISQEIADEILTDIENGGVFGKKDKSRKDFYKEATHKRSNKTDEEYSEYIERWQGKISLVNRFFLPLSQMKKQYVVLNTKSWLLPVLWGVRLFKILIYKVTPKKVNDDRLNLLKKLDII